MCPQSDRLSSILGIYGIYTEASLGQTIDWKIHRTITGLFLFIFIGFAAGMFGLGAGWANVPVLNLTMGVPLKISVGTSKFLLSITDTSAAWIYMNKGCVIPMMVVPSIVGIMAGSFIGVRILRVAKPTFVRWIVIAMLLFAGAKGHHQGAGSPLHRLEAEGHTKMTATEANTAPDQEPILGPSGHPARPTPISSSMPASWPRACIWAWAYCW